MRRATPHLRHFAKRLIVFETQGKKISETKAQANFPVPEKLRPQLTALAGNGGFQALLARALALAKVEVPWLRAVHVKADGSLEGLTEIQSQLTPAEFLEGKVVLLAQLLGLLVAFIGETLTLRLVREVWPKVPLDDLAFDNRESPEKRLK
ncbi:MAG TPA: hypothetical protein VK815_07390 [Candidatus Acidoferrales bacterium]|jgi:hypothetical protein|nr:hypothetical protein [Candidatus Acidoferrales bacterium]